MTKFRVEVRCPTSVLAGQRDWFWVASMDNFNTIEEARARVEQFNNEPSARPWETRIQKITYEVVE